MKENRNQPCPCRSGKKLKHCCLKLPDELDPTSSKLTLRHRNILLLNAISDIFELGNKKTTWDNIRRTISEEQVYDTYSAVADLFPPGLDIFTLFPPASKRLRALYLGDVGPEHISRNVCRFGLYADEIFIVNPFLNPWGMAPGRSPLDVPNKFLMDTLRVLYFITRLYRWIMAGVVTLVPNPCEYDWRYRERAFAAANERVRQKPAGDSDLNDNPFFETDLARHLWLTPPESLRAHLKSKYPQKPDDEIDRIANTAEALHKADPVTPLQHINELGNQMLIARRGTTLETAFHICDLTGSFPYTTSRRAWNDILSMDEDMTETERVWSPLTRAFQDLEFRFLDNVDADFAFSIREDGRLHGFRALINQIWSSIKGAPDAARAESLARDFADQVRQKYGEAEAEWERIDRDLYRWATGSGSGLAGAVVTGALSLHLGAPTVVAAAATAVVAGAGEGAKRYWDKSRFRATVPMSVFVDLARHKPRPT
ncbi:MAG TPA: SEC-C domain-containing protein [Sorangium sp.]|nr:SEC-C domain-containing protein [Sorangium sp.]